MTEEKTTPQRDANSPDIGQQFRNLPAVETLLRQPDIQPLIAIHGEPVVKEAIRATLDSARAEIRGGGPPPVDADWPGRLEGILQVLVRPSLRPAINATGVIIHTNLGRAPLSREARRAIARMSTGYSNLEYDLAAGERGSRHVHAQRILCELTGAEDALIVNNNASAVFLVLAALCQNRQVIISRGQLVEIGGGFRIPDVLRQSGAALREVGTTNRTHARDFVGALGPRTAALMRVHSSNFRQLGFVTMPPLEELVEIAGAHIGEEGRRPLVVDDLGSGTLLDTTRYGLAPEPTVQASVEAGADLITFSGDKLLGGPQAGLIVGRTQPIERLRQHPLARALRVDKMTLAGLEATLASYLRRKAVEEIPVWQMIVAGEADLEARARAWQEALAREEIVSRLIPGESTIGGGSLPGETLPTTLLSITPERTEQKATLLRELDIPIICRIKEDRLLFDPRTVLPEDDEPFIDGLIAALTRSEMATTYAE